MPTREQVERSRERNRERGIDRQYIVDATANARLRAQKTAAPAPKISSRRGPEPPVAA